MDFLQLAFKVMLGNAEKLMVAGAIMVSVIIMLVGALKHWVFNRIKNDDLRKTVLSLMSVVFSFIATFFYYLFENINWRWYVMGALVTSLACIVVYHFYENYHLRKLVHKIGNFAIDKFAYLAKVILAKIADSSDKSVAAEWNKVTNELKNYAQAEIKSTAKKIAKADKELQNL
jgi:hypothetical protein